MSRLKTQNQVTHTQVKNTRRKPVTALKRKKMRTTCQSKILIRISIEKWGLVTMKKKKAVGRNKRVKRETELRTEVVADLERGMAIIVIVTNQNTKQIFMKEKGVKRETKAEVQRNPKIKKSLSTDER
ncbi:PPIL4 isoform 2 [Pongo abelii]|uniref:PPIL4 isoform 2 n=1 Tax=Pongo abelii TaxID=9601 RepID=A0A2J8XAA6_PONAB|nr:PPIL4 isoform 2 [Pongo abelii]